MTPTMGSPRRKLALLGTTFLAAGTLALSGPVAGAFGASADGPVKVSNTETVKAELGADGSLHEGSAYLFSQISATGNGKVSLQDPTSTNGLRNLDGWGAPKTRDGKASYDFTVDGTKQYRTVSKFTKALPVSFEVSYHLDGKALEPSQLAGKSGWLEVTYRVKNTSAKPTELTYTDGYGKQVTETHDVVTPYVGQLTLDLPGSFSQVTSDRADIAGNGRGGHLLAWTLVLFEPIGQVEQEFGYAAQVKDLALPPSHVQILPVEPQRHPELLFGQKGFEGGAASGQALTVGAALIDENLLKLRDGASTLLSGLTQLYDGATKLHSGLADTAVPGAKQLADGLGSGVPMAIDGSAQLAAGAKDAAAGAKQVSAGSAQLAAGLTALQGAGPRLTAGSKALNDNVPLLGQGAKDLAKGSADFKAGAAALQLAFSNPTGDDLTKGSQQLAVGLGLLAAGLDQLADSTSGLPKALSGAKELSAAVHGLILPALGDPAASCNPATPVILPCLGQITTSTTEGLPAAAGGLQQIMTAITKNPTATDAFGDPGLRRAIQLVEEGLAKAVTTGGDIDKLEAAITATDCGSACKATVHALLQTGTPGQQSLRATTTAAQTALASVLTGIGDPAKPAPGTLVGGLTAVSAGLADAITGLGKIQTGLATDLRGGLQRVDGGLDQLVSGLTTAVGGIGELAPGARDAKAGAGKLSDGVSQAGGGVALLVKGTERFATGADGFAAGAGKFAAGTTEFAAGASQVSGGVGAAVTGSAQLAAGAKELSDGLEGQLAPGAQELASKLQDLNAAKDGAKQLADGLGDAADGSKQIADGLSQAKDGGTQIVDGAGQLSEQGTKPLQKKGEETAKSYGLELATMQALNAKGATGALPYGAPEGSQANRAAYDLSIDGVGGSGGASNPTKGAAGVVIFAASAGVAGLLRRRFAG